MSRRSDILVYGANGRTGRAVCAELEAGGAAFVIAGRDRIAIETLGTQFPASSVQVASIRDVDLREVKVVVSCAGPAVNETLLGAALAAGAHFIDLGGEQAWLHGAYERFESAARRAGQVVLCGAGLDCAIGDWAAAWAAAYVCGVPRDDGPTTRSEPIGRLAEDRPLDDIAISYVFDNLTLSPGGQRAAFDGLHTRGLAWRRDRWESVPPAAERRRINAGAMGERDVVSFPGGDVVTIPRHINAQRVQTFVSTTRNNTTMTALRMLARAVPFVPKAATDLLATYEPSDEEYARTRFAVIAQAKRGFSSAQVVVSGSDLYRTSAVIAAWIASQLVAASTTCPVGMLAPSQLFRPESALREVAEAAGLVVEPSFA
jgi:short subunit dehydrogenase-like uncharacterized protein